MDATTGAVLYHKLQLWEPGMESEEEEEEEEIAEPLVLSLRRLQNTPGNKVGGLPGAWTRLLAGLLLLAVSSSLALRQLQGRNSPKGNLGSVDFPASRHSHHPGVYHHSAVISPAGQCLGRGYGSVVQGTSPSHIDLSLLQPHVPNWAKSCLSLGAMSWMLELEQLCVWRWCILMQQG